MGTGTQAHQLHSPQTGLGSLCVCVCVYARVCVCARTCTCVPKDLLSPHCLSPKMPGWLNPSFWAGGSSQWPSQLRTGQPGCAYGKQAGMLAATEMNTCKDESHSRAWLTLPSLYALSNALIMPCLFQ